MKTKAKTKANTAAKATATAKAAKAPAKKNVAFTLRAEKGRKAFLAGCFNSWDPTAQKMRYRAKDGVYATSVKLAPGTYQYKFVVDGEWLADPECADWVRNDCGTLNSVITVK